MSTSFLVQSVGIENLKRLRLASESLAGALASKAADKLRASVVDALPESPFNLTKIGGTALTGRDWSGDFAKLQNLDTALSTRASESTLSGIKTQTDKLTFDTSNRLAIQNPPNMDVALSTRASESTLSSFVGTPDSSPPSKGVLLLGYDGTYVRRVKTTSDGKLLAVLG
jgi:hypothetical protein